MLCFAICKFKMSGKAKRQSIAESNRMYKAYRAVRGLVYAGEIVLMVTVQEAFYFYGDFVRFDNIFYKVIC